MQSVWRIVFTFIFRSDSRAATSSGVAGFVMRLAAGLSCTGTLRCISTLAAAEEAMALPGGPPDGGRGAAAALAAWGITIFSEHDGQLISEPAPELSTA